MSVDGELREQDASAPPAAGERSAPALERVGAAGAPGSWWRRRNARLALYAVVILLIVGAYRFQVFPGTADALVDYFIYMCCATTVTPLPVVPVIFLATTKVPALYVALIGAAGTTVAYLLEYAILRPALRLGVARKLKDSRAYVWLCNLFRRAPFGALAIAALLPLPVDGVRLMAISEGYSKVRYAVAAFIGRVPRYFLVALPVEIARRNAGGSFLQVVPRALGPESWREVPVLIGLVTVSGLVVGGAAVARWRRLRTVARLAGTVLGILVLGTMSPRDDARADSGGKAAAGAPPSVELSNLLARFDRAVGALTDARARFEQERYSPIFEDTEHWTGALAYRAPGDLMLHYKKPAHQEVFIDSAGVWLYLVEQEQAQRYPFAGAYERDASLAILWQPSRVLSRRYRIEFPESPPSGEEEGAWLHLIPEDTELARVVSALYLRIEPATALTDCIVVERENGERLRLEITEFEHNPGVEEVELRFVPPPGVEIIE